MPSPFENRADALTEAIVGLLRRLEKMDARLVRLETLQGIAQETPAPSQAPPPEPERLIAPAVPAAGPPREPAPGIAAAAQSSVETESTRELETRVGLTWINRIGVLTLIFAVAFFFKYAVDNQWIGEAGRVALGTIAGFAALAFAEFMWRRGHRIYAQGITGAGIAILYLSFYSSFGFYRLVGQGFAFVLMALTTAMAGALAIRYRAVAISILGLVGGYLTPVLLSTHEDRPWAFLGYVMLLNVGAIAVARTQGWRRLERLAFVGTVVLYTSWFADRFNSGKQVVATFYALAYYLLFGLAESPAIFAASQVLVNLALLAIWPEPQAAYLWLSLAVAAAGLVISQRRPWPIARLAVFGSFWGCCALWQASLWRPRALPEIFLELTLGFLLFLAWAAWRILARREEAHRQELAVVALNGVIYFGICYHLLSPDYHAYLGLFAAAMAAIHLALGRWLWSLRDESQRDLRPVLLCVGVALGFLTLAAPIQFSGYRITMAWAVEGAALAWIGARTESKRLVDAALVVLFLTLARLCSIDAWIYRYSDVYHVIANNRFLTFAIAAVCFWLAARWIRSGAEALAPYVAGHFVMVWALVMEVLVWAARTAPAANAGNLSTVSVTVLLAAYGVALVVLGVVTRLGVNRLLGLGLLALVVLKLYLSDVWQLARMYRVIAFTFLGVLLLVTSFLYSRYRASIESWWRNENRGS
jgi:uncharacterized membrane protein